MNAIIIAIGNELLNGEVIDSNSSFLQKELSYFGIQTKKGVILGDEISQIEAEIKNVLTLTDFIFIMGGLGPTEDDLTRYAIGKALNRDMIQDQKENEAIENKFRIYGHKMSSNNEKQSFFPKGSRILDNPIGTASGFHIIENNCQLFVLPGVPSEMKLVYKDEIIPILKEQIPHSMGLEKLIVKVMGTGESSLDSLIQREIQPKHSVRWEIIAKGEGIFLKFYPKEKNVNPDWKDQLKLSLNEHIGSFIYGYDEDEIGNIIASLLTKKGLTFGTVESCTGGYISKYITDRSGSSAYFLGGLVTYSNDLKTTLAHVSHDLMQDNGVVSIEVAEAMALGGKKTLKSDLCLSVTGIAGPGGGTKDKPVGTVCFAVVDQNDVLTSERCTFNGDRKDVRRKSLFYGLNLIRLAIEKK